MSRFHARLNEPSQYGIQRSRDSWADGSRLGGLLIALAVFKRTEAHHADEHVLVHGGGNVLRATLTGAVVVHQDGQLGATDGDQVVRPRR